MDVTITKPNRRLKVYICGPFRGDEDKNREMAELAAADVWKSGHIALCPHLNSPRRSLLAGVSEESFLSGYIELLRACDAILLLPGWSNSEGSMAELKSARGGTLVSVWLPMEPGGWKPPLRWNIDRQGDES